MFGGFILGKKSSRPVDVAGGHVDMRQSYVFIFPVPNKSFYFIKSISILYCWSHCFLASQTTREDKESIHTQLNEA